MSLSRTDGIPLSKRAARTSRILWKGAARCSVLNTVPLLFRLPEIRPNRMWPSSQDWVHVLRFRIESRETACAQAIARYALDRGGDEDVTPDVQFHAET